MFEFSNLSILDYNEFAFKNQSLVPNNQRTRDILLIVKCGNQEATINLENPGVKQPKPVFWSSLDMSFEMRVEEHVFKLERDEAKMLKRLKETNLHATGINTFLLS